MSYRPQGNGLVERSIRSITIMILKVCENKNGTLDYQIITLAYITRVYKPTKICPFEALFGQSPESLVIESNKKIYDKTIWFIWDKNKFDKYLGYY